jgi:hypothetical protein
MCIFFISCGHSPKLLESVNQPFYAITLTIQAFIKPLSSLFMTFTGNNGGYSFLTELFANNLATIAFITQKIPELAFRPPSPNPFYFSTSEQILKTNSVVSFSGCQSKNHRFSVSLGPNMNFSGETSNAAP